MKVVLPLSEDRYGRASIVCGVASMVLVSFVFTFPLVLYVVPGVVLVGLGLGIAGVNTKSGAFGILANFLAGLFVASLIFAMR